MTYELTREEWKEVTNKLRAPVHADEIELKWANFNVGAGQEGEVLAYVTARGIRTRLDEVVPGGWEFTWEPVSLDAKGHVEVAKGRLTICGVVREDVCEAPNISKDKGVVSGLEKRLAQQFGIGRDLYDLPNSRATADHNKRIPQEFIDRWRKGYAKAIGKQESEVAAPRVAETEATEAKPVLDFTALKRDAASTLRHRTMDEHLMWIRTTLDNSNIKIEDITPEQFATLQEAINKATPAISGLKEAHKRAS